MSKQQTCPFCGSTDTVHHIFPVCNKCNRAWRYRNADKIRELARKARSFDRLKSAAEEARGSDNDFIASIILPWILAAEQEDPS